MYVLLDNAASDFVNSVSVDRIGFVSLADPLNCPVEVAALEAALVEAEAVEAAVEAELEALVDEEVEDVLEAEFEAEAEDQMVAMNLAGVQDFAAENDLIAQDDEFAAEIGGLLSS